MDSLSTLPTLTIIWKQSCVLCHRKGQLLSTRHISPKTSPVWVIKCTVELQIKDPLKQTTSLLQVVLSPLVLKAYHISFLSEYSLFDGLRSHPPHWNSLFSLGIHLVVGLQGRVFSHPKVTNLNVSISSNPILAKSILSDLSSQS